MKLFLSFLLVALLSMPSHAYLTHFSNSNTDYLSDLPKGLSVQDWTTIQKNVRLVQYCFVSTITDDGIAYLAVNHPQQLRMFFDINRVKITEYVLPTSWYWQLSLSGYGYGNDIQSIPIVEEIIVTNNRLEYQRGDFIQWYMNDEEGIEHGFILLSPPQLTSSSEKTKDGLQVPLFDIHENAAQIPIFNTSENQSQIPSFNKKETREISPGQRSPLRIKMALNTDLFTQLSQNNKSIAFINTEGNTVLNYDKLHVYDALGQILPAHFTLTDNTIIVIVIDDRQAIYPISIN
ncbi:hypothetical protein QUF82_22905 [Thiotrichales bacterium HSG14]|nr:hypothetical protein [Thiotrichales bacterium HSG14]